MNLSQVTSAGNRNRRKKRVGRGHGSGHGKTSTRGHKGAGSRSGAGYRRLFQGGDLPFFRHLPKRGFTNTDFETAYVPVNVERLQAFKDGDVVDPAALEAAGIVNASAADRKRVSQEDPEKVVTIRGKALIKILGDGELTRKLTVRAHAASKSAIEKIEKAGGKFESLAKPKPQKTKRAKKPKVAAAPAGAKADGAATAAPAAAEKAERPKVEKPKAEAKAEKPAKAEGKGEAKADAKPKGEGKPPKAKG
jgi:large subunit ribosomal protein L15